MFWLYTLMIVFMQVRAQEYATHYVSNAYDQSNKIYLASTPGQNTQQLLTKLGMTDLPFTSKASFTPQEALLSVCVLDDLISIAKQEPKIICSGILNGQLDPLKIRLNFHRFLYAQDHCPLVMINAMKLESEPWAYDTLNKIFLRNSHGMRSILRPFDSEKRPRRRDSWRQTTEAPNTRLGLEKKEGFSDQCLALWESQYGEHVAIVAGQPVLAMFYPPKFRQPLPRAILETLRVDPKIDKAYEILGGLVKLGSASYVRHYAERDGVTIFNYREGYTGPIVDPTTWCEKCSWWNNKSCTGGWRRENLLEWKLKDPKIRLRLAAIRRGVCGTAGHLIIKLKSGEVRIVSQGGKWGDGEHEDKNKDPFHGGKPCGIKNSLGIGYEDPRLFTWRGTQFVIMNGCYGTNRAMFLHDVAYNHTTRLWVRGAGSLGTIEKNWTPYVDGLKLRLIYSFGDKSLLGVLDLVDAWTGECRLVYGSLNYADENPYIGSTPLQQWIYPYYVGFVHTRHKAVHEMEVGARIDVGNFSTYNSIDIKGPRCNKGHRVCTVYRSVVTVVNVKTFEATYGKEILFPSPDHTFGHITAKDKKDVQYPYDLAFKDGKAILGLEYQDKCPSWVHIDFQDFSKLLPVNTHSPTVTTT
eukprot:m.91527 g.91527  ORF g.91527 m.91527 type:complete len:637 (+) comp13307_c0_seq1:126-2036(+)